MTIVCPMCRKALFVYPKSYDEYNRAYSVELEKHGEIRIWNNGAIDAESLKKQCPGPYYAGE